jgi:hypothetical protein
MKINLKLDVDVESGTIYLIPKFIRCIHCGHEIPIGLMTIKASIITDYGGCGKESKLTDYVKYFGSIENITA